eukprot:Gb_33688 [translate_table: standard]
MVTTELSMCPQGIHLLKYAMVFNQWPRLRFRWSFPLQSPLMSRQNRGRPPSSYNTSTNCIHRSRRSLPNLKPNTKLYKTGTESNIASRWVTKFGCIWTSKDSRPSRIISSSRSDMGHTPYWKLLHQMLFAWTFRLYLRSITSSMSIISSCMSHPS